MSEPMEAEQKTNPQGDVISTTVAIKTEAGRDPHAEEEAEGCFTRIALRSP
jgi:hypothetical protein